MDESALLRSLAEKNSDAGKIAGEVTKAPELVPGLLAGLGAPQPAIKYKCDKVVRVLSEKQPELLYSHFDLFTTMLDAENSFLKWGAILTIANLARVDAGGKFETIFDKYFSPIPGPAMITAANAIRGSARIAAAKPELADRISTEILKVEKAVYKTPECKNVAIGHAIDSFDKFFDLLRDQDRVIRFVTRQLKNTRNPVRRRAERFLKKWKIGEKQESGVRRQESGEKQ